MKAMEAAGEAAAGHQDRDGCLCFQYCWWFRNPARKPADMGVSPHYLQGFSTIPGGCLGFLLATVFVQWIVVFFSTTIFGKRFPLWLLISFKTSHEKFLLCGHRCDTRHACEGFVNNLAIKTCFSVLHVASWSLRENIFQPSDFVLSHVAYLHYLIPCLRLILAESS